MKPENKIFLAGSAVVCLVAFGYIGYINLGNGASSTPSNVAFSSSSNMESSSSAQGAEQPSRSTETISEQPSMQTGLQGDSDQISGSQEESVSSIEGGNTGIDLFQAPAPVPPSERDGSEIALALRNERIKTEAIQQRLVTQGQTLHSLQQQVDELAQQRHDYQERLNEVQRSNDALRSELSGKALYEPSNSNQQEASQVRVGERNGYQLTKLFQDQAWIQTPQGRTYIVGEGDWFGNEYVISINGNSGTVITSAGELGL